MLRITIPILFIFFLSACRRNQLISLKRDNTSKAIAIQPLDKFDHQQLALIGTQISNFFNIRVVILEPVEIPPSLRKNLQENYSADSLVKFLSRFCNDTIVKVVGITHKDLSTIRSYTFKWDGKPFVRNEVRGIFGMGLVTGNSCIVSDYRLVSNNKKVTDNRLLKTIIHEIGHNLGLMHCPDSSCLMSETNGDIIKLSKVGGDFCAECRRKID